MLDKSRNLNKKKGSIRNFERKSVIKSVVLYDEFDSDFVRPIKLASFMRLGNMNEVQRVQLYIDACIYAILG